MFYNGNKIGQVKFDTNCNNGNAKKSNVVNHVLSAYKSYSVGSIWHLNESREPAFTTAVFFPQSYDSHWEGWHAAFWALPHRSNKEKTAFKTNSYTAYKKTWPCSLTDLYNAGQLGYIGCKKSRKWIVSKLFHMPRDIGKRSAFGDSSFAKLSRWLKWQFYFFRLRTSPSGHGQS